MRLVVVSTTFAAPDDAKRSCIESVAAQRGVDLVVHTYIDAAEQDPPRSHFENLIAAIGTLPPETVVVALDGDDWLGPRDALARVAKAHAEGAWVTWGSFVYADGRPGFARALTTTELVNVRRAQWGTTHLKSFRAGLFQRIDPAHLKTPQGEWLHYARDMALMFPVIEMAGPERSRFIPEVLCVYNYENSSEHAFTPAERAADTAGVAYVCGLPQYVRVESL